MEQSINDDNEDGNNSGKKAGDDDATDEDVPNIVEVEEYELSEYQLDLNDEDYKGSEPPSTPNNRNIDLSNPRHANTPKSLKTLLNGPY